MGEECKHGSFSPPWPRNRSDAPSPPLSPPKSPHESDWDSEWDVEQVSRGPALSTTPTFSVPVPLLQSDSDMEWEDEGGHDECKHGSLSPPRQWNWSDAPSPPTSPTRSRGFWTPRPPPTPISAPQDSLNTVSASPARSVGGHRRGPPDARHVPVVTGFTTRPLPPIAGAPGASPPSQRGCVGRGCERPATTAAR